MAERGGSSALVILVGAFALAVFGIRDGSPPAGAGSKPATTAAAAATPDTNLGDVGRLLDHYYAYVESVGKPNLAAEFRSGGRANRPNRVVLATITDPLDSHTPYLFDEQIDALLRAAGALGYSLKSHSLPWSRATSNKAPPGLAAAEKSEKECWAAKPPGTSKAELQELCRVEKAATGHRASPGALLFVRSPEGPVGRSTEELLLVLLVGETPTTGAHPTALHKAIETWRALSPSAPSAGGEGPLMVIGPTFSGSASGLVASAERFVGTNGDGTKTRVDFFTGSATADKLTLLASGVCTPYEKSARDSLCVHQITHTDAQLEDALCRYLETRAASRDRFALLFEGATAYGANQAGGGIGANCRDPLVAAFPVHISQLRAASETSGSRSESNALSTPLARRALDLTSDEFGAPIDVPASQSPSNSAVVTDLRLADTLAGLRERDVGWAVLLATDVRDKVFLAEHVRRSVPEIQLSTLESDIFLTHPRFTGPLLGMVVASSYPVSARVALESVEAQAPADGTLPPRMNAASSSVAEGMTTAAVLAFQGIVSSEDCGAPLMWPNDGGATARACAWLDDATPPVWISVVGRDGLWPLVVQPLGREPAKLSESKKPIVARPSMAFRGLLVLLSILGIHHTVRYFQAARGSSGGDTRFHGLHWLLQRAARDKDGSAELRRLRLVRPLYLALVSLALAFLTAMSLLLVAADDSASLAAKWLTIDVPLFTLALGLLPALFDSLVFAVRPIQSPAPPPSRVPFYWTLLWFLVPAAIATRYVSAWMLNSTEHVNWSLYAYRTSHLHGGVSSAMPILFVAGALWLFALALASRAALAAGPSAVTPFPQANAQGERGPFAKLADLGSLLLKETAPLASPTGTWLSSSVVIVVLAAVPALAFGRRLRLPLDGTGTWILFLLGTVVLLFAIVGSGVRLFRIWLRVRELLGGLPPSLMYAFRRLPDRFAGTVGFEPLGYKVGPAELQYAAQQAAMLASDRTPADVRVALVGSPAALLAADEREQRRALANAARDLLPRLHDVWTTPWIDGEITDQASMTLLRGIDEKADVMPQDAISLLDSHLVFSSNTLSIRLAEEFVAGQIVFFVSYLFAHLRTLILSCSVGLILLLLAMTSYPFQPQTPTVNFVVALFGVAISAAVVAIVQSSRNEILSLIENTRPNSVSWNATMVTQLIAYVALPALAVLSSQLPALGHLFSTLFDAFTPR